MICFGTLIQGIDKLIIYIYIYIYIYILTWVSGPACVHLG